MLKPVLAALPSILIAFIIFLIFWILAKFAVKLIHRIRDKNPAQKQPVFLVFETITKITILLLGLITALGSAGVNVSALVASLGVSGIAITLASKDAFANLFAGILVLLFQPFHIGDTIEIQNIKGVVTKMSLRYTHLLTNSKEILVPNSALLTQFVIIDRPGS
ncbi:MAG: mechanosensitive ion channel [Proteobacteria bacterium]|nr:mechanosensitive ion channel [Pseudomonadota bacterium]